MVATAKKPSDSPHASPVKSPAEVVWIIDDEESVRQCLFVALKSSFTLRTFTSIEEAAQVLPTEQPAVLLSDHYLPGENGLDFLTRLHHSHPGVQRILMTGHSDLTLLTRAINEGAVKYFVEKPFALEQLRAMVRAAAEDHRRWQEANAHEALLTNLVHQQQTTVQRETARLKRIWRLSGHFALSLLIIAGLALALGIVVLLVLYALKCLFGFDVFENAHLGDLF